MIVKVCGMVDPENIKGLEALGNIDWMGMIFYPKSKRYLPSFGFPPSAYLDINLPKVGVFVNEGLDVIKDIVSRYGLQKVQLHGDEPVELVKKVKAELKIEVIKVFRVGENWNWEALFPYENHVDCFLFDTDSPSYGGTGHRFNWEILKQYPLNKPFLLSGGIGGDHIAAVLDWYGKIPAMEGIDINSKFERQPGIKDLELINKFVNELKTAESKTGSKQ